MVAIEEQAEDSVPAPAGDPVSTVPPPISPTMGGLSLQGSDYYVAWTGGKPNSDWSGLVNPDAVCIYPSQTRSTSPKAVASQAARHAGLYPGLSDNQKFQSGGNLTFFITKLRRAFVTKGMDTICYRRDPLDHSTMVDVLVDYPRLNQESMLLESSWCLSKFDTYDSINDSDAREFLLASVSSKLEWEIQNKSSPTDTFVDTLFILIEEERPQNVDRAKALVQKVMSMSPTQYPNENVSAYVSAIKPTLENLEIGRLWDSLNNSDLCRRLANCGGENNHEFNGPLFIMLNDILRESKHITHLSNEQKAAHMTKKKLSWRDVLKLAEDQYKAQTVETRIRWPPMCNPRDSKAAPLNYGSVNLTQFDHNSSGNRDNRSKSKPQRTRNGNGNSTGKRTNPQGTKSKNPKFIPPDSSATPIRHVNGKPVYQKTINGRTMEWCAMCKRYSTTHNTGTHTGRPSGPTPTQSTSGPSASLGFGIIPDPSLWYCSADFPQQCFPVADPVPEPVFDRALASNHSWSSVLVDLAILIGPHVLGFLSGVSFFSLFGASSSSLCSAFDWISALTVGDLFHSLWLMAPPVLWFSLFLLSLMDKAWLDTGQVIYQDPRTQPQRRTVRRLLDQALRRLRRKYFRRRTVRQYYTAPLPCFKGRKVRNHRVKQTKPCVKQTRNPKYIAPDHVNTKQVQQKIINGRTMEWCATCKRYSTTHNTGTHKDNSKLKPKAYFGESVILQHPCACQAEMSTDDTYTIVWDSGASFCVSYDKKDFTGPLKSLPRGACIKGIANNLRIEGIGEVLWSVLDDNGKLRHLKLPAYYIPKLKQRLLSTTVFNRTYPSNPITITSDCWKIAENPSSPTEESGLTVFINPRNNLPITTCFRHSGIKDVTAAYNGTVSTVHSSNFNLSEPQKELLRWHYKLGHIGLRTVQFIMRTGILASSESMRRLHSTASKIKPQDLPRCSACQFGRQQSRSVPKNTMSTVIKDHAGIDRSGILSADQVQPGQRVFIDHFVCTTRGRRIKGYGVRDPTGKSPTRGRSTESYCGGLIFVDASTGYVHSEFQSHLSSTETIQAVENFERLARDNGIIVSEYGSDNGSAFTSAAFREHLQQHGQVSRLSGAGSHHQNGRAERCIRTITAMARTMLLHSAVHWPEMADPSLWALAVRHAVWIYNHLPNPTTGISPVDLWTKTRFPLRKLHDLHVFGSPVYVLQKKLSDGKSIGKWQPRSNRCVNLGFSDQHAKTVPLVLNPSTGSITPQWNVVFDDWFSTVSTSTADLPDFQSEEWSRLFGATPAHFPDDDFPETEENPFLQPSLQRRMARSEEIADSVPSVPLGPLLPTSIPSWPTSPYPTYPRYPVSPDPVSQPLSSSRPVSQPFQEENRPASTSISASADKRTNPPVSNPSDSSRTVQFTDPPTSTTTIPTATEPTAGLRHRLEGAARGIEEAARETATRIADSVSVPARRKTRAERSLEDHNTVGMNSALPTRSTRIRKQRNLMNISNLGGLAEINAFLASSTPPSELPAHIYHQLFAAKKNSDPDTLSYNEAMADTENLTAWKAAAAKEIQQLEDKLCWEECLKSEADGEPIIPSTWVFRRKRNPAGDITKYKARICLRGDLMNDDEESFAPVCSWSSVRLFLVLAMIMHYVTVSVDWNNAFIQAMLKKPMYMGIPRGFSSKFGSNGCVRLLRSLYGSKFAPRNWYMHLRAALLQLGFKESTIDPCLLYRNNILMVLYVDDAGIAAPSREIIDHFVQELKDLDFDLDIEDDFNSYLGIGIAELPDGSRHMTQKGLIKKIIETAGMETCNPNKAPCTQIALGSDPEGKPYDHKKFSYPSIVGMLLYLSNNTRPDITFAVSQVARFTHSPKESHATAVKTIIRYLKSTQDKGLIVKPDGSFNLKCWVDADFSGLHGREPESSSASAKSRYGYIITFAGVPLVWKSQLISEICLSTLHAEYVGLAAATRALIPLRSLTVDVLSFLELPNSKPVEVHCTVFEDNQGAYLLATNQRVTARTKYFNVKHHFFWSYVHHSETNPGGWIVIVKCPTDKMNADYLTKGLGPQIFGPNRHRVQGW